MGILETTLSTLRLDEAVQYGKLTMYPLSCDEDSESDYLTLDEGIKNKKVRITEITENGSVPELLLTNDADKPVLILDGEELIGAKQNRVVNLTILSPAFNTMKIPVSCVEQGRWSYKSDEFIPSERMHFNSGRAKKNLRVSESLHYSESRHSDQSEVWDDVSEKMHNLNFESPTEAMSDIYDEYESELEQYKTVFTHQEKQRGVIFAINQQVCGLELFDSPATCKKLLPKLVQSYALDAIDEKEQAATEHDGKPDAMAFLDASKMMMIEQFPALGLGVDLRLSALTLSGGALSHEDKLVHLCVFRIDDKADNSDNRSRMSRASTRSRRYGE